MSSHKYTELKNLIMRFRVVDLHVFLGYAGLNKQGRKSILQRRAIEFLRSNCSRSTEARIQEIYRKMNTSDTVDIDIPMATRNRNAVNYEQDDSESSGSPPQQENWLSPEGYHEPMPAGLPFPIPVFIPTLLNPSLHFMDGRSYETHGGCANNNTEMEKPTNWSFTLTNPEDLRPNLKMAPLPFFEHKSNISRMKVFRGQTLNLDENLSEYNNEFSLNSNDIKMIKQSKRSKNGRDDDFHILLRVCSFKNPNEENDCSKPDDLPEHFAVKINGQTSELPSIIQATNRPGMYLKRINDAVDITRNINVNDSYNHLTFSFDLEDKEKQYAYTIDLVRKRRAEELICELQNKPHFSVENAMNQLSSFLAGDDDIITTSTKISLLCPLTKTDIKLPCKSIKCNHMQCFDGGSFIQMNHVNAKWICPVCNKTLKYEDLVIDQYFLNIIESDQHSKNAKFITILADGTWEEVKEQVTKRPNSSARLEDSESETESQLNRERGSSIDGQRAHEAMDETQQSEVIECASDESSESEEETWIESRRKTRADTRQPKTSKKGHVLDMHINALRKKAELQHMQVNQDCTTTQINPSACVCTPTVFTNEWNNGKKIMLVDLTDENDETMIVPQRPNKRKHTAASSSDSGSDTDTELADDIRTYLHRKNPLSVLGCACLYSVNVRHGEIIDGGGSSSQCYHQANSVAVDNELDLSGLEQGIEPSVTLKNVGLSKKEMKKAPLKGKYKRFRKKNFLLKTSYHQKEIMAERKNEERKKKKY